MYSPISKTSRRVLFTIKINVKMGERFAFVTEGEINLLLGTDNVHGQISEYLFALNGGYCLYIIIFMYIVIGPPAAAEIVGLPPQTKDTKVTIKWNVPQNNGAFITQYNVYQRTVNGDGPPMDWKEIGGRKNPLIREVNVTLEKGEDYEFLVTATNKFGESWKDVEKIKKIVVLGGECIAKIAQNEKESQTWCRSSCGIYTVASSFSFKIRILVLSILLVHD